MTESEAGIGSEPFYLELEVFEDELADWLRTIPPENLRREVENTLRAGH